MRLMRLGANQEVVVQWLMDRMAAYEYGVALLAVHAGIAFSDAVLIRLTGKRSTAQNHEQAIPTLKKECGRHRKNAEGIPHFEWLVKQKDYFAYGERRLRSEDVVAASVHVEDGQMGI
jgi:hypothetical protein